MVESENLTEVIKINNQKPKQKWYKGHTFV